MIRVPVIRGEIDSRYVVNAYSNVEFKDLLDVFVNKTVMYVGISYDQFWLAMGNLESAIGSNWEWVKRPDCNIIKESVK